MTIAMGVAMGWQGYSLHRDGWPLNWIWGSFVTASRDVQTARLRIEQFFGLVENISGGGVQIEEAYIISRMDGSRLDVRFNDRAGNYLEPTNFNPLPPGSEMDFRAVFGETGLSEEEFWRKWAGIEFIARYSGREYRKIFVRQDIEKPLEFYQLTPPKPYPSKREKSD